MQLQQPTTAVQPAHLGSSHRRSSFSIKKIVGFIVIVSVLGMQAATLYFTMRPPYLNDLNVRQQIIDEVAELTSINVFEQPAMRIVKDADAIRKQSNINAEIYQNAKDGDYVLAFTDKLVIYRRDRSLIVYDGETPSQKVSAAAKEYASAIGSKLKEAKVEIAADSAPQLTIIVTPADYQKQDAVFYKDVKANDVIAVYSKENLVAVYRPDTQSLINYGKFNLEIKK